jgi:hypothetical protein
MQRYRDTHDVLHALLGVPVSVTGEVALKWFEMAQTRLPMTALAAFFGGLRAEGSTRAYVDWCARAGRRSRLFLAVDLDREWESDLLDLRQRLGLPVQPDCLPSLDATWDASRVPLLRQHYQEASAALGPSSDPRRRAPFDLYLARLDELWGAGQARPEAAAAGEGPAAGAARN